MIYLDNAATSAFKPEGVITGVTEYLKHPGNPERGCHAASLNAAGLVLDTRMKLADFFGMEDCSRVIFTGGLTESLNMVINGLFSENDHVITTIYEHNSVLRPLYRIGCEMTVCSVPGEMEAEVRKNTRAVIMNHVSNVTGQVQDIAAAGKICRKYGLLLIVDAGQSAGHVPLSMKDMGIDILCFSGHKGLMGMQGIGGICIRTDENIRSIKAGGTGFDSFSRVQPEEYPYRLEAGTLNVPGIVSLYHGIDFINEYTIENIAMHERKLRQRCLQQLEGIEGVEIYYGINCAAAADINVDLHSGISENIGIISFNIKGMDAGYIADQLSYRYDIAVRSGAHCAPLIHEYYGIGSSVRISFGLNNTEGDVDSFIEALKQVIG
ncbi:MAG: aminotransferase class V-fold PLP-dependent enzyme [Parasporobacterium sp.]|nr:aminotransferase class V-fold PLP-dependent enzyme [Parasporobacterium sp.]